MKSRSKSKMGSAPCLLVVVAFLLGLGLLQFALFLPFSQTSG